MTSTSHRFARSHQGAERSATAQRNTDLAVDLLLLPAATVASTGCLALTIACDRLITLPQVDPRDPVLEAIDLICRWLPAAYCEPDDHPLARHRLQTAIDLIDGFAPGCGPIRGGTQRVCRALDLPYCQTVAVVFPHIMRHLIKLHGHRMILRFARCAEFCGFFGVNLLGTARRLIAELIEVRDALDLPTCLHDLSNDRRRMEAFIDRLNPDDPLRQILRIAWRTPRQVG